MTCTQCNALSKRTRQRCKAPAIRGKTKCRVHGGAKGSGRPIIHGRETREKRAERSAKLAELRELEEVGFKVGLFAEGTPRTRGRKPVGCGKSDFLTHVLLLVPHLLDVTTDVSTFTQY